MRNIVGTKGSFVIKGLNDSFSGLFHIFETFIFCFVVAMSDLVHDVGYTCMAYVTFEQHLKIFSKFVSNARETANYFRKDFKIMFNSS